MVYILSVGFGEKYEALCVCVCWRRKEGTKGGRGEGGGTEGRGEGGGGEKEGGEGRREGMEGGRGGKEGGDEKRRKKGEEREGERWERWREKMGFMVCREGGERTVLLRGKGGSV